MSSQSPFTFVLFGATGDLALRKILPALCSLVQTNSFIPGSKIIAYSRRPWTNQNYHAFIRSALSGFSADKIENFLKHIEYVQGVFDDPASYARLKKAITTHRIFYHLAVQPEFYNRIIEELGRGDLKGSLLIEKPFGRDGDSADKLEKDIEQYFLANTILRIDHYLGKPGLDVILQTRRDNPELEARLNADTVASIHCRIVEDLNIEGRGEFYDTVGALRDVGQNHLLEMIAMLLLNLDEAKISLPAARAKALASLIPVSLNDFPTHVVRVQYKGYTKEPDVKPTSQTETYFKITTASNNPAWTGVPIILEGGKGLNQKKSDITVTFKDGTKHLFDINVPKQPDAYQVVIEAALAGDHSRFVSFAEVKAQWDFCTPIITGFNTAPLHMYPKGSHEIKI